VMPSASDLSRKHCAPCEGGVPPLPPEQVRALLKELPAWGLTPDGGRIRHEWRGEGVAAPPAPFPPRGGGARRAGHPPPPPPPGLHLVGYRNVAVEIWTHAVGGLTENDFILAAKIDQLPVALKQ